MNALINHAAPFFAAYVYPTIVGVILSGVALVALGIGIMVFRAGIHS